MKIGILTQPLHSNYGGLLQNYALQQILLRAGFEVETIDWCGAKGIRQSLSQIKLCILHAIFPKHYSKPKYSPNSNEISVIRRNTNDFIRKYINRTKTVSSKNMFVKQADSGKYDAFVVGSDQCWRPCYNSFLSSMFLDFARDKNVRRIAYAASFGTDKWEFSPKQTNICAPLAKKFDLITVREDSGIELCKKHLGVDAIHVLDPTMLLTKDDYIHLIEAENEPPSEGTLFNYILDPDANKTSFIRKVATETGLKVFQVLPKCQAETRTKKDVKSRIEDCVFPSVTTWLRAFMDAKMTIVDSFHGMVFSIIFNKPFWVIGNEHRGMSRFISLLKVFHLEDRLLNADNLNDTDLTKTIDWTTVNYIVEKKRVENKSLLLNELQK